MSSNPVERNFVTRTILGLVVIAAMFAGAGAVGGLLRDLAVPYGGVVGVTLGAILVFAAFVVLYRRYDSKSASA